MLLLQTNLLGVNPSPYSQSHPNLVFLSFLRILQPFLAPPKGGGGGGEEEVLKPGTIRGSCQADIMLTQLQKANYCMFLSTVFGIRLYEKNEKNNYQTT